MKKRVKVLDKEIIMKDNDFIVSKTNKKGIITYCNEIFMDIASYEENELLGKNHNIIRHPDMPKAAFKLAWDLLQTGNEFFGFVKNKTKNGEFYWVFANITPDYDDKGSIIGYTSVRRKPNAAAIKTIIPIYKEMINIEKQNGMKASSEYLFNFLSENNISYTNLILSLQEA